MGLRAAAVLMATAACLGGTAIAGCIGGKGADGGADRADRVAAGGVNSRAVAERFAQRTGDRLIRGAATTEWDVLGFSPELVDGELNAGKTALVDKFGTFTIYVLKNDFDAKYKRLIEPRSYPDAIATTKPENAEGIVWTQSCEAHQHECAYTATKRFGTNLVLTWQAGQDPTTDTRWDRLASALEAVVAPRDT